MPLLPDGTQLPYPGEGVMQGALQNASPPGPMGFPSGIPPELMALLAGAGGQAAAPPRDGSAMLREALQVIAAYQQVEVDDEDLLEAEEIRTRIQKLLAKQQKEQDGLLQGKVTPSALRGIA